MLFLRRTSVHPIPLRASPRSIWYVEERDENIRVADSCVADELATAVPRALGIAALGNTNVCDEEEAREVVVSCGGEKK